MAMMACPICGKQVSQLAPRCPGCGHPINPPRKCRVGWLMGCGCLLAAFFTLLLTIIIGLLIWIGLALQPPADDGMGDEELAPQEETACHCDPAPTPDGGAPTEENPPAN